MFKPHLQLSPLELWLAGAETHSMPPLRVCREFSSFLLLLVLLTWAHASFSSRAAEFLSLAAFFTLIQIPSLNLTKSIQWYPRRGPHALLSGNCLCETNESIIFKFKAPRCLITWTKSLKLVSWHGIRGKVFGPFPSGILLSIWNFTSRMLLSVLLAALNSAPTITTLLIELQAF